MEFTKENVRRELDRSGTFTLSYRLPFGAAPTWVSFEQVFDRADTLMYENK